MRNLRTLLEIITTLIKSPPSIRRVLQDEDKWKQSIQQRYGFVDGLPTIDLLDLVPEFHVVVEPYSFLDGTSTVLDIALLNALANRKRDCKYLEIGTWKGESIANVSKFVNKGVSLSLSEAEMRQLGLSDEFIKVHKFFSEGIDNVDHIGHNSHTFNYSLLNERFDLVFIDGDHNYRGVKIDTQNAFKILRDDKSIIVWHDYGKSPETVRWDVLAGILDGCPTENRKYLYHVSNTLCAIFIKSEFDVVAAKFPQVPNKKFKITILAEKI